MFPDDQVWPGLLLAVFQCTLCVDEDHLIPEMLTGRLQGGEIPDGFLIAYQRNFRFIVSEISESRARLDYVEKVRFQRLDVVANADPTAQGSKIGGIPSWRLEDEAPASYAGSISMAFLLQLEPSHRFETVEGAPRQIELGLDWKPRPSGHKHYELFIGNDLFLFGTDDPNLKLVYAITQVD